jgi:hypothetical protein
MFSWTLKSWLLSVSLRRSSSRQNPIEQQAEGGERLTAVLHRKAKQYDSAGA